jgi:hypothetical protein
VYESNRLGESDALLLAAPSGLQQHPKLSRSRFLDPLVETQGHQSRAALLPSAAVNAASSGRSHTLCRERDLDHHEDPKGVLLDIARDSIKRALPGLSVPEPYSHQALSYTSDPIQVAQS